MRASTLALQCPACKTPRALADRVCRGCRLHFESGKVINLNPPRAASGAARHRQSAGAQARAGWIRLSKRLDLPVPVLGVVPGLGHWFADRRVAACIAAVAIVGLEVAGLASGSPRALGLGIATHSYSIFELTPLRFAREIGRRFALLGGLALGFFLVECFALRGLASLDDAGWAVVCAFAVGGAPFIDMAGIGVDLLRARRANTAAREAEAP